MSLRLIEILLPRKYQKLQELFQKYPVLDFCYTQKIEEKIIDYSYHSMAENRILVRVLSSAEGTEEIVDYLETCFEGEEDFRVVVLPVEASIPRPVDNGNGKQKASRVYREELYNKIIGSTEISFVYLILVALASAVAAVGLITGNIPFIIGSMVIAPLLGPNMALSLATTMGEAKLIGRSLSSIIIGALVAVGIAVLIGLLFNVDSTAPELVRRTVVSIPDLVVALAAGGAGALSFTSGVFASLMGVMVAVALLPPLVAIGIFLGSGLMTQASQALLLLLLNFAGINLAGLLVLLVQKLGPKEGTWRQILSSRLLSFLAICFWTIFLAVIWISIM
jgi:uncharacterized hydrophobic protein (TIGR00341 family)